MQMRFPGSIGHPMAGFGLQESLKVVDADNKVSHMMTGSRAVSGYILVDVALSTILLADTYNIPVLIKGNAEEHHDEVVIDLETRYSTK